MSRDGVRLRLGAALFSSVLGACQERVVDLGVVELSGPTMGTSYHVRFVPDDAAAVRRAQSEIDALLATADAEFSLWRDDSVIRRFNAKRTEDAFPVSEDFRIVVALALRIAEATDGEYDPTVLPLTRLYGFAGGEHKVPSDAELAAALSEVGWRNLSVDVDGALRKARPGVELDLNSIAPGHCADRISQRLCAIGLPNHMVEVGGEIVCRGLKPDASPWQIGIERPAKEREDEDRPIQEIVALRDEALATSGSYRNWFESKGTRRHHILDARTGRNRASDVVSVTVIASDCALADGLSTALMLAGPDRAPAILRVMEPETVRALFLLAGADGAVTERRIDW